MPGMPNGASLRRLMLFTPLLLTLLLAACSPWQPESTQRTPTATAFASDPANNWSALRQRPLKLPALTAGTPCPTTTGKQANPGFGIALGDGPAYPVGFDKDGVYRYRGTDEENGWLYLKVLWIADPAYKGPLLVRGGQIDGPGELRFERGPEPPAEMELSPDAALTGAGSTDWPNWPTYTRLRGAGCYAYQVDGTGFSKVIIFKAADEPQQNTSLPVADGAVH